MILLNVCLYSGLRFYKTSFSEVLFVLSLHQSNLINSLVLCADQSREWVIGHVQCLDYVPLRQLQNIINFFSVP